MREGRLDLSELFRGRAVTYSIILVDDDLGASALVLPVLRAAFVAEDLERDLRGFRGRCKQSKGRARSLRRNDQIAELPKPESDSWPQIRPSALE